MDANSTNGKLEKSMTEHFSLRHKVIAVAMSVVMLGFGWPAVSPDSGYAENGTQIEDQQGGASDAQAGETTEVQESEAATDGQDQATSDAKKESTAADRGQDQAATEADSGDASDIVSYSVDGLGTYVSQVDVASDSAIEDIAAKIIKLDVAGNVISSDDATISAGNAADLAKSNLPDGYEQSYVDDRANVKVGNSVIHYVGKTSDGKTFVKTSEDQLGGIILEDGKTVDFYYTQIVNSYNVSTKVTLDGKEVASDDMSKYVKLVAPAKIKQGATGTATISAVDGYTVSGVTISSGSISGTDGVYSISNVDADTAITIAMKTHDPYNITFQGSNTHFTYTPTDYTKVDGDSASGKVYSSKYGVPSGSVTFSLKGINQWDDAARDLNVLTLTIGGTTYPVNLPSTATEGSSAETTVGSYKVTVTFDGYTTTPKTHGGSGTTKAPIHTVTIESVTGGTVAGDIAVYVNHKNSNTYEVWAKELTGVKDEKAYVDASGKPKTLYMSCSDFNGNFAERNSGNLKTTVYFNVADGYKTDASTITVQLVDNGALGETLTATKLSKAVIKDGTSYNYSFTIPASDNSKDLRFIVQCQPDESNIWAVYKDADGNEIKSTEVSDADSFKVADGVTEPTKAGKFFLNWQNGSSSYDTGAVIVTANATKTFNKDKGRYEIVFQPNFGDEPSEESYPYKVNVYIESADKAEAQYIGTVDATGPAGTAYIDANDAKSALVDSRYYPALLEVDADNSVLSGTMSTDPEHPLTLTVTYKYKTVTGYVQSYDGTYDGESHKANVNINSIDGCSITASSDASVKDVDDKTVTAECDRLMVTYNGNDVTGLLYKNITPGTIKVNPKGYAVTTGDATKVYDGTPLLGSAAEGNKVDGLVAEGDATFTVTGSQTEVGGEKGNNTYTLVFASDRMADNYKLDTETLGTLTVTEYADVIEVTTTGGEFTYDGKAHGATVEVGDLPKGYSVEKAESTATATDVADGTVGATADQLKIVNAAGADVTGNLNIKYNDGTIKVNPKGYAVTTGDATKVYDGTPLLGSAAEGNKVDGLVAEGDATFTVTGSQTEVGGEKGNNTYTLVFASDRMADNYKLDTETLGTLTVKAQSIVPDPDNPESYKGVQISDLSDLVYNGKSQEQKPTVMNKEGVALIEGVDYEILFSNDTVNAGTVTVTVSGIGNYTGVATRIYQITPAPYTVVTDSAEKVYNGEPLTAGGNIEGIVDGEDAGFEVTGSRTEVGTSANTYVVKWSKSAKQSNYEFKGETLGTLTVTAPAPAAEDNTPAPKESNDILAKTGDSALIYGVCAAASVAALVAIAGAFAMRRRSRGEERR